MKTRSIHKSEMTNETTDKSNINYGQALKQLKEAERKLQLRKRQIKAQGLRSQRGRWHADEIEKRNKVHQESKNAALKLQHQQSIVRAKQLQKIARLKQQGEKVRQENLKKRSMSRLQLLQRKIRLNHSIREQSIHNTQKIINLRQYQLQKKRDRRLSMYGSRKQSRLSVQEFKASRISLIRSSNSKQRDALLQKLKQRQKELYDLQQGQVQSSKQNKGKGEKEHRTTQNLKSIDTSIRIYNPSSGKISRKRSLSDRLVFGQSSMITQI